ncbi:unnamed protein product [Bursaphelenchus okinawaensis]|uniref:Uncharacterized protein n=1 Tax=Bursaphelenchus okinawaensis TaxID=465554 RepID=A0A811KMV8_9BILA|nr:unnamed protein product [Bursaphelenchus okinawaensis]CAG9105498.1 unnamed protein product [Bursaphelenchus okinawaensis]
MQVFLAVCVLCHLWSGHSKTVKKEQLPVTIQNFNFTKRPLNLYIPANAVHVKVEERRANGATYFYAEPPFLIKRRGNVLVLHDLMDNNYFNGRPSIIQQIAASGHFCYFVTYNDAHNILPSFNSTNAIVMLESPSDKYKSDITNVVKDVNLDGIVSISPKDNMDITPTPTVILNEESQGYNINIATFQEIVKKPIDNRIVMQVLANFLDFVHPR